MADTQKKEDQEKMISQLKSLLRISLNPKSYERMMNVMLVNPKLFANASQKIVSLYQRFGRPLTENEVLMVLKSLRERPKTGGISIKRK